VRFLIDMNLSPRWVDRLASAGIESTHWSKVGAFDAADEVIMAHAADQGFVVLTHDLDFGAMLAAMPLKRPSVVQLRADDVSPEVMGSVVVAAVAQMQSELSSGALLTIDPGRSRIRLLPLHPEN
jgi:predicted nuclease of predicted toxin-antitoxin system